MSHRFFSLLIMWVLIAPFSAYAEEAEFIQWHSTNIQLLRGWEYDVGSQERTIATFEHANGWMYGDFFMFVDYTWPDKGESRYYAELSPRFSLSKITGKSFSYGLIKDVLVSTTVEKPEHQEARYLYGGAVDLNVPGFKFFNTNAYIRDNQTLDGKTWQITLAWNRPFKIENTSWVIEGFADFAGSEGRTQANQLIVPRLLLDVGELAGIGENTLWMGVEYSYWHNKFGIDGKTESVPQLQAKWVF